MINLSKKSVNMIHRLQTLFALVALLLGGVSAMAQEPSGVTPFTTYYGRVIEVGDTLWMGIPKQEKYISVLLNKANESNQFLLADLTQWHKQPLVVIELPTPKEVSSEWSFIGKTTIQAKCKAPDGTTLLIDVDQAVYDNVLQMAEPYDITFRNTCVELTPLKRHLYYLLTEQIELNDQSLLEYMILADPDKGEKCKHDQFEFRRVKAEYADRLQRDLTLLQQQIDNSTTFYIKRSNLRFDDTYDPTIGGYQYTKLYDCNRSTTTGYSDYLTHFIHQPCETILTMTEPMAERYERKRKGDSPYLDRDETAVIYLSLMPFEKEPGYNEYVTALLLAVEVFDDPSGEANYLGRAQFDPQHYDKVQKQLKRQRTTNAIGTVVGGVLGLLSIFK